MTDIETQLWIIIIILSIYCGIKLGIEFTKR